MKHFFTLLGLRAVLWVGERVEDLVLVGDEGCLWPVEFLRDTVARRGGLT